MTKPLAAAPRSVSQVPSPVSRLDARDAARRTEDIYEVLTKAGSAYKLPSPWHNIPCDPSFFALPLDKAALLSELRRKYTDADLIRAGVAMIDAAQAVVLHPQLAANGAPIWAIRAQPKLRPTALIAQLKHVGNNAWAVASAFRDYRQSELIAAGDDPVVVGYSMADLAILRSLGIAAVPGGDWNRLSKPQLDRLCQRLRITTPSPQPRPFAADWKAAEATGSAETWPEETRPLALILANWSLAAFELADNGAAATSWSHLVALHQNLDLLFDGFGLWQPTAKHLERLGYQLQYRDVSQVRAAFLSCMYKCVKAIDADHRVKLSPSRAIFRAYRAWQLALRDRMNVAGSQEAFARYCALIERYRFKPLVAEALQASCPLERNLELALADTSRLLQPQVLLHTENIRRSMADRGTRGASSLTTEELAPMLALFDRQLALTKGVLACRQTNQTKTAKSLKPPAVRSAPSAAKPKKSPR